MALPTKPSLGPAISEVAETLIRQPRAKSSLDVDSPGVRNRLPGSTAKALDPQAGLTDMAVGNPNVNAATREVAEQASKPKETDFGDTLNGAVQAETYAGLGLSVAPLVLGAGAGAVTWAGNATKLSGVASTGEGLTRKIERANEYTFGDVAKKFPGLADRLKTPGEKVTGGASRVAEVVFDKTGLGKGLSRLSARSADKTHKKAVRSAGDLIETLHKAMGGAPADIDYLEHMREAESIGSAVRGTQTPAELAAIMPDIEARGKALTTALKDNKPLKAAFEKSEKSFTQTLKHAGESVTHQADHIGLQNMAETVKKAPAKLANTTLTHGLANGAFVALDATLLVKNTYDFTKSLAAGKRMMAAINGQDPSKVSTLAFMTSKDPIIAAVRSDLVKDFGIDLSTQAGSLFLTVKNALRNNVGFLPYIAIQGAGIAAKAVAVKGNVTPMFIMAEQAEKSGQTLPATFISEFLVSARDDLKNRGATGKAMADTLAAQYEAEGATISTILAETRNGKYDERVKKAIAPDAKVAALEPAAAEAPQISMQDRVSGKKAARPAVGEGTWTGAGGKLDQQSQIAALQSTSAPAMG